MLEKMVTVVVKYHPLLLAGMRMTIWLSLVVVALGTILGTLIALLRLSKSRLLRGISKVYIEVIRGTPILVQLYIFVFGLPSLGIKLPELYGVIIAMSLNSAAYVAEIIRSGIQAVDSGQAEAARSLGMPPGMTMRRIVLPQAVKNILPALGNEFVTLVKESSLASTFFLGEIMTQQKTIQQITFSVMDSLLVCALLYFIITFTLTRLLGIFERRLKQSD